MPASDPEGPALFEAYLERKSRLESARLARDEVEKLPKDRADSGPNVDTTSMPIQRFKLKDYRAYNGVLASDPGITPEKVRAMTKILKEGGNLPEGIKVAKTRLMNRKGPLSKDWDEFDPEEDDIMKSTEFYVITDGHHRFISYVEAGVDPLEHVAIGGEAVFAYSWNELGGIDEEL